MNITKILSSDELSKARLLSKDLIFMDGKESARGSAKDVKENSEASPQDKNYQEISNDILAIMTRNVWLQRRFLPKFFSPPIINRYKVGESYGRHYDTAHMRTNKTSIRKDFSYTIMLSGLNEYEGGELEIEAGTSKHKVRLDAGDMVIYPSTKIHRVLPVTKGERLAYVGWIASHVKDPLAIELLNLYEDLHIAMGKYQLSRDDELSLTHIKNKLQHLFSD